MEKGSVNIFTYFFTMSSNQESLETLLSSRPPEYDGQDHKATWGRPYPLKGQGTLIFNLVRDTAFTIVISPAKPAEPFKSPGFIALKIGEFKAEFVLGKPDKEPEVIAETTARQPGFVPKKITSYWYSFDHNNLVVKYGKGYIMEKTTLLEYNFIPSFATHDQKKKEEIRKEMSFIFDPTVRKVVMLYDVAPLPILKTLYSALNSSDFKSHRSQLGIESADAIYRVGTKQKLAIVKKLIDHIGIPESEDNNQGIVEVEKKVDFYNFPLVTDWPQFVKDSSEVTLYDLDENRYTFSASLPSACIELYKNVKNADLNYSPTPEKYKLSDAIGYSMNTEGCFLYNILQKKQGEFGTDKHQVYLRVTLGPQRGMSPGVPYVLELWPKGCGSPIHNHGNTYAVIHVLHGGLTITIYNKDLEEELKEFKVNKGDITWISPNWYQAHKLWNYSETEYCATIQCYQYGETDKVSWPYFDFLNEKKQIDEFLPDSDCRFKVMRVKVMEEYRKHMECKGK